MIAFTLSAAAASAELDYGVLAGVSYSDNVERVPANEESSGAAAVGFDLRGSRTTGRLLYDVYANLEYRDYFDSDLEGQEFGRLIAQSSYAFVPETFTEGARTTFEGDVGHSQIKGAGVDEDGPMARVRLTRRLTPFVSAFIGYTREFPTSADAAFTPDPEEGDLVEDASILTAAPRENEVAEIGLNLARPRTTASLVYARRTESTLGPGSGSADRDFDDLLASFRLRSRSPCR